MMIQIRWWFNEFRFVPFCVSFYSFWPFRVSSESRRTINTRKRNKRKVYIYYYPSSAIHSCLSVNLIVSHGIHFEQCQRDFIHLLLFFLLFFFFSSVLSISFFADGMHNHGTYEKFHHPNGPNKFQTFIMGRRTLILFSYVDHHQL